MVSYGICVECKVRDNDSSEKELHQCPHCGKGFCEKHLQPKLAYIRDYKKRAEDYEVIVAEEAQIKGGHPCMVWSSKVRTGEIRLPPSEAKEEVHRRVGYESANGIIVSEPFSGSKLGECRECITRRKDSSKKQLQECPYCEESFCEDHSEPKPVFIRDFSLYLKYPDVWVAIQEEIKVEGKHPCFQFTDKWIEEKDRELKLERELLMEWLDKSKPHRPSPHLDEELRGEITRAPREVQELPPKPLQPKLLRLGECPECGSTDSKMEDYDAKTISYICNKCSHMWTQSKAYPHEIVKFPGAKPAKIIREESIKKKPQKIPVIESHPPPPYYSRKPTTPRKRIIRNVTMFAMIIILIGGVYHHRAFVIPTFLKFIGYEAEISPTVTTTIQTPSLTPTLSPTPTEERKLGHAELVNYALDLINEDRSEHGVSHVTLSSVTSAQEHAEDMLEHHYISHWDTNGYKPYMRYTLTGGKGLVYENVACHWGNYPLDPKEVLKQLEWNMMYDDEEWDWGHRDNILDPHHNKVSIGIAYDVYNLCFVQNFENDYTIWTTLSHKNGIVILTGDLILDNLTLAGVTISHEPESSELTPSQLGEPPYVGSCAFPVPVGYAVPPGWISKIGIQITAEKWIQQGKSFQIEFDLHPVSNKYGKGVYTLMLYGFYSTDKAEIVSIYCIWYNGG